MKIESVRVENFRCFHDETIDFDSYTCLVGPNGAGKSTVLTALNVFFRERTVGLVDPARLTEEDYFERRIGQPVRITVTFNELSIESETQLAAYVRQGKLVVTASATFDPSQGFGAVKYFGQRLGHSQFRPYFEADKAGAPAKDLQRIFDDIRSRLPALGLARTKDEKALALQNYEESHPEQCELIPSEDAFYGVNSTGKLSPFVQWVYVPAVKDANEESQEAKNTAIGRLIVRAVRAKANFETEIEDLRKEALDKYQLLLMRNDAHLKELASALQTRLEEWAHPGVQLNLEWLSDAARSITVVQPVVGVRAGDSSFVGSIARLGHGLQRSYLLALLQELASAEAPNAPTLILGIEEPELYQHPPQARHLADVLEQLSTANTQVVVTTHSPTFVSGAGFEQSRIVRANEGGRGATVRGLRLGGLCSRLRELRGESPSHGTTGLIAKIHQSLQPGVAEMFFCRIPVLVEGMEDVAYITTQLHLSNRWQQFRKLGCHLIPVHMKSRLIQPLAIATELEIPCFLIFDGDNDITDRYRGSHEKDNRALTKLRSIGETDFLSEDYWGPDCTIWSRTLTERIKTDFGESYDRLIETARIEHAHESGLEKNSLFIANWLTAAQEQGLTSPTLTKLTEAILNYATLN